MALLLLNARASQVRPAALVVNLEHVKCLISQGYVLINNSDVDRVRPLVDLLRDRLRGCNSNAASHVQLAGLAQPASAAPPAGPGKGVHMHHDHLKADGAATVSAAPSGAISGMQALPFELMVLEACLEQVVMVLDRKAASLDSSARQAVEGLVARVTSKGLERMRQLKNRMTYLQKTVGTCKELLRKLLEDGKALVRARSDWPAPQPLLRLYGVYHCF
jgi:hypothetical protein